MGLTLAPYSKIHGLTLFSVQMFAPGLEDFGISESDFPAIVEKAKNASSMKGNPIPPTDQQRLHDLPITQAE